MKIFALPIHTIHGEPSIRYRGIFINDEAPALTGWVRDKFGKYGVEFYKKVFDLLLRLKVGEDSTIERLKAESKEINRQTFSGRLCGPAIRTREPHSLLTIP